MAATFVQPNRDSIAAEVMEGDAVIINIATSVYYSTEGIGGWVWEQCSLGVGVEDLARDIACHYEIGIEDVQKDLAKFTGTLVQEGLATITRSETPGHQPTGISNATKGLPYAPPMLNCYRDMKDLLALDPPMPRFSLDG